MPVLLYVSDCQIKNCLLLNILFSWTFFSHFSYALQCLPNKTAESNTSAEHKYFERSMIYLACWEMCQNLAHFDSCDLNMNRPFTRKKNILFSNLKTNKKLTWLILPVNHCFMFSCRWLWNILLDTIDNPKLYAPSCWLHTITPSRTSEPVFKIQFHIKLFFF